MADMEKMIKDQLEESQEIKAKVATECIGQIIDAAKVLVNALGNGKKVLLFGNGGSASDSQHIACELVSRFRKERKGLPAIALTTDTSILTAIPNDYNFARVFVRQVEALGDKDDVAIGLSTSGTSLNVIKALETAKEKGLRTIALTGERGGKLKKVADVTIMVPSHDTARVQEAHITIGHILCGIIEEELF